jgi:signal transduction histidine kinase
MPGSSSATHKLLARYERLIEISQQLNSTLDLTSLLRHIVSAAVELTDSEAASILLLDDATGELRFEQASNMSPDMGGLVVPLEGSIAGWVASHGEARVIQDVRREPSFFPNIDQQLQFQTRNLLAVPMHTRGQGRNKVVGVLEAVNKKDDGRFTNEDIKTLTILAGQAAVAIENARLFQQSDFMSEMVHELRTPLLALKTSITLLSRPDIPEERRADLFSTMQGEAERLISLTNNYLDLARLESGRTQLEIRTVELELVFRECLNIVQSQAQERGIQLSASSGGLKVQADRGKLMQVLINLLSNAIKYNQDGGSVSMSAVPGDPHDPPMVEIAVQDTGYGISKQNQRSLFTKFFRASNTSGTTTGTGLGLAIARHIVEGHGGTIWLSSEPGVGSTFYLTMPASS